jgi:general L-amino acid transport system substrate-binding protein
MTFRAALAATCGLALTFAVGTADAQQTLTAVKARGQVICGVTEGTAGFSAPDDKGVWKGFDADVCRAVAAAIFGDPSKVRFTPTSAKDRFPALTSGEVDLLARNTTWTMSRDTSLGFNFGPVTYYDGQGFMVRKTLKVASLNELAGASICANAGSTTELNTADYFRSKNMKFEMVTFGTADETVKAYESGRCDVFTTDTSSLYAMRLKFAKADDHIVLPEVISKEPLAPVVRHGDDQWFDLVKWTVYAMLNAEELGVTSKNVDEMMKSTNPEVKRLLGVEGNFGEPMGVSKDWAFQIIKKVGNYSELFEQHLGKDSRLGIDRGLNRLWNKGGLQYAPPIR